MNTSNYRYKSLILFFCIAISSCGGGGGSTDTGSTINANYTKGPVSGATALLKDINGNTVAGPVLTVDGQATFTGVSYVGAVYTIFSGGSYTDEATGATVTLDSNFKIRSGVVSNSGSGTLALTATPLTEIGFKRALINSGGSVDLTTVNNQIQQVADEYGLDSINLTTVAPTALENITGNSDEDRYGTVLAAITQQLLNDGQAPSSNSLDSYINSSVSAVDNTAFNTAVADLQTNTQTQTFINSTVINSITNNTGISTYTVGGTITGLTGSLSIKNNAADTLTLSSNGSFTFSTVINNQGTYSISISSQPASQTCSVANASGTVSDANVNTIDINCSTDPVSNNNAIWNQFNWGNANWQ